MIGKKVPNPHKSNTPSARVRRLADYIDAPENAPPNAHVAPGATKAARVEGLADYARRSLAEPEREKCIYGGSRGFQTAARAAQKAEMVALAQVSAHSKDPINHYVLSWRQGERPTPAQIEEAVDIFLDTMGLTGHQTIYGLHVDTDNAHLHLMVNRVHPVTRKVVEINQGFDLEALHRAVARIEHVQGWRREARGRYRVQADGTLRRDRHPPLDRSSADARRVRDRWPHRHGGGATSAAQIAAEAAAPAIRAAASWADLHARLAERGLRYARAGQRGAAAGGRGGVESLQRRPGLRPAGAGAAARALPARPGGVGRRGAGGPRRRPAGRDAGGPGSPRRVAGGAGRGPPRAAGRLVAVGSAGRGRTGRRYAYGDAFDASLCNAFESHIRRTTPVGVFPGGETPERLIDMTGNSWDWTGSLSQPYPYIADDGREDPAAQARRVVRGGAWFHLQPHARAASRYTFTPGFRNNSLGFRVVCASSIRDAGH